MSSHDYTLELRKAYRLIHSYQKSTINLANDIGRRLGLQFDHWEPSMSSHPPPENINPVKRNTWEMLPMYCPYFVFRSRDKVSVGSSMLVLCFEMT